MNGKRQYFRKVQVSICPHKHGNSFYSVRIYRDDIVDRKRYACISAYTSIASRDATFVQSAKADRLQSGNRESDNYLMKDEQPFVTYW